VYVIDCADVKDRISVIWN